MTDTLAARRGRAAARRARLQAGAEPILVGLLELRDLVLDHLDPGRLFHQLRHRLEQRRPGGDRLGLADHLRSSSWSSGCACPSWCRPSRPRAASTGGRQARRLEGRLLHRLAQPDRPARDRRLGGLRLRDFFDLTRRHVQPVLGQPLLARPGLHRVRRRPGARRGDQHLLQPPARGAQQRLGLVARRRRGRGRADPDHRPEPPRQRLARSSPTPSTTPGSSAARPRRRVPASTSCRCRRSSPSTRSPATTPRRTCPRRPRAAANSAAKGIWRSIFYSAIGGWILLLSFLFAVQDEDGVTKGGGAVAVIFSQALTSQVGRHGPADLDGRPVLLHGRLHDQHHPDALRVQP